MNWGYKILTVYIVFVAGIGFLVVKSSMQNQDLVIPDYYEQELKYQDRIDETARANALSSQVSCQLKENGIIIDLPKEMNGIKVAANVLLYCTADKSRDVQKNISTENSEIRFAVPAANKGLHELQIKWTAEGKNYYFQQKLFIQ